MEPERFNDRRDTTQGQPPRRYRPSVQAGALSDLRPVCDRKCRRHLRRNVFGGVASRGARHSVLPERDQPIEVHLSGREGDTEGTEESLCSLCLCGEHQYSKMTSAGIVRTRTSCTGATGFPLTCNCFTFGSGECTIASLRVPATCTWTIFEVPRIEKLRMP